MRTTIATFRRFIAAFVTLAMLTSSIAMAAYVCPKTDSDMSEMTDCAMTSPMQDRDDQNPVQCAEYSAGEKQALEHTSAALDPALPAIISVQLIQPAPLPPWRILVRPEVLPHPALAYLRTLRLRI